MDRESGKKIEKEDSKSRKKSRKRIANRESRLPAKLFIRWSSYATSWHHLFLSQIYIRAGTLAHIIVPSKIKHWSDSFILGKLYMGRRVLFRAFQRAIKRQNWVSVALNPKIWKFFTIFYKIKIRLLTSDRRKIWLLILTLDSWPWDPPPPYPYRISALPQAASMQCLSQPPLPPLPLRLPALHQLWANNIATTAVTVQRPHARLAATRPSSSAA